MRLSTLLLFITFSGLSIAQSKNDQIEDLQVLNSELSLKIDSLSTLTKKLEEVIKNYKENDESVINDLTKRESHSRRENSELRSIMKGYVYEIDSLYTVNKLLREKLEKTSSDEGSVESHTIKTSSPFDSRGVSHANHEAGQQLTNTDHREVIRNPSFIIESDVVLTFAFKVRIDDQGNVISATLIKERTNTIDPVLINKVQHEVKRQVKYSKIIGAPIATKIYSLSIQPN